ncbi:MAG: CDP-alcohol phosphatidyltransferase family protein [Flavobacterium sp.]|nr:CDP-alcohol phosphatidyltransferase family protein [Flavobacterium sp.]
MKVKNHIPNLITLLNLFCGCIALVFVFNGNHVLAFTFVCLGIFLDFFDGFFARLFNVSSPLGLQLDSLADMVTSGVVPGAVMFFMLKNAVHLQNFELDNVDFLFCLLGFAITLGACYRLANFNIDERQTDSFIGLPTPANALFILSLPLVLNESVIAIELFTNKWILIFIVILSTYIMNAEIPLFALKIKNFSFKKYSLQISFLLLSIILLLLLQIVAVPLIIVLYVFISILKTIFFKKVVQ